MSPVRSTAFLLGLAFAAGCGGESKDTPEPTGVGSALEIQAIAFTDPTEPTSLLEPGGNLELWGAPQGGHVSRVGARIVNLDSDDVELRAELRDETGTVISSAVRTTPVTPVEGMSGVMETDRTSVYHFAHLALCPDPSGRPIDGETYELTLLVTELYADFSEGSAVMEVSPSCNPGDSFCLCECAEGYSPAACALD
jgi:hypothetical protein